MKKTKVVAALEKVHSELASAVITPLYSDMLKKREPAMTLIDLTLATYEPIGKVVKDPTTVNKADVRFSLLKLREAIKKHSGEASKDILAKIDALEFASIGEKK